MNRLTYPAQPEIMTFTTPLGTTHYIPVWHPIGERNAPVMVEELPKSAPRALNPVRLTDRIHNYFKSQDHGDRGLTHWQIADALGENRQTVGRSLMKNSFLFWRSSNVVLVDFLSGSGNSKRKMSLNLWKLKEQK